MSEQPTPLVSPDAFWELLEAGLPAGQQVRLPVLSGSMAPLIPAGSQITLAGLAPDTRLVEGDVVVFCEGDRLVAHRLLFCCPLPAPGWYLQRGDGVSGYGIIDRSVVRGRVVAVHDPAGRCRDLTTPTAQHQARRTARRSLYRLARGGWWRDRRRRQA